MAGNGVANADRRGKIGHGGTRRCRVPLAAPDANARSPPVQHLRRMAVINLKEAGLIRDRRGHITVLDRDALEHRTCECYAVVKKEYDRLLPATHGELSAVPARGVPVRASRTNAGVPSATSASPETPAATSHR